MIEIHEASESEIELVVSITNDAFEDEVVTQLVKDLLVDPSASPRLSLLAFDANKQGVGHVLFSAAYLENYPEVRAAILAPLSVVPAMQGRGVGTELAKKGLELLAASGTDLVFVLGYPGYYPRFGFTPAVKAGFQAPYPIEEKNADAWMVLPLGSKDGAGMRGMVRCAEALDKVEYWRE